MAQAYFACMEKSICTYISSEQIKRYYLSSFAVGIVPLYCYCSQNDGKYEALPIYKALRDEQITSRWSAAEYKRLEYVHKLITKTAIGVELNLDSLQEKYISFADSGYHRHKVPPLEWDERFQESLLYQQIQAAKCVCYAGDPVTDGMKNGGYGWYEPLMALFPEKKTYRVALGGMTSQWMRQQSERMADLRADIYILAFGCNDIQYRQDEICAMDAQSYIANIDAVCQAVHRNMPTAKMVLISPWMGYEPDPYCHVSTQEKARLYDEYSNALNVYAEQNEYLYINPNPYIRNVIESNPYCRNLIYKDHIHPNAGEGIRVFSKACLMQSLNK